MAAHGSWERDGGVFDRDDSADLEPPVPPGLGALSGAQRALAEFLRLDDDLFGAAAAVSAPMGEGAEDLDDLAAWVDRLPAAEKNRLLERVVRGEAARVRMELLRRFRSEAVTIVAASARRTVPTCSTRPRADGPTATGGWPRSAPNTRHAKSGHAVLPTNDDSMR
ncbi:hypothetical protein ACWEOW_13980 [Monashia sp. NPDC004114]